MIHVIHLYIEISRSAYNPSVKHCTVKAVFRTSRSPTSMRTSTFGIVRLRGKTSYHLATVKSDCVTHPPRAYKT